MLSVVIPTRNGRDDLARCLAGIAIQRVDAPVEVIVVDSSSTDGTSELARASGARVQSISPTDFNHGATRNLGASLATGEILVFTSQDAYPARPDWLDRLTRPLRDESEVAGTYGRQLAHEHATPPERFFLDFLYGRESRIQRAASPAELTMDATLFSNANAALRRSTWESFPFADDIIMSEDQEWSRRVLLAGRALRYEADAVVRHSHAYTVTDAFRRFFDSGVSAERAYLAGGAPATDVVRRRALDYARGEVSWLWRSGHAHWIPYAVVYEGAKFAGLQLGIRHERLPRALPPRLSAQPAYWAGRRSEPRTERSRLGRWRR